MTRTRITALAIALAVAAGAFFLLRGEDSPPPEKRATDESLADAAVLGSLEAEAELERRSRALEEAAEKAGPKAPSSEIDALDRKSDAIGDLAWRAFDKQFRRTPFDKVVDELPLRKPPLHVQQWVLDSPTDKLRTRAERERFYRMSERKREAIVKAFYASGTHKLYARVDRERFYGMSLRAREAAVKAFYRDARPRFKRAGINDFVLVVTPLTETTEHLPALAVGRGDSAALTALGRADAEGS